MEKRRILIFFSASVLWSSRGLRISTSMTELHDLPGHLIRRLHQISVAAFTAETAAGGFDLTPVQYAALFALRGSPGADQATLAGRIAHDRVTIGGVIARLEARGYLERAVSASDRRAKAVRLTGKGMALLDSISETVLSAQRVMLQGLSADERDTLMRLLRKATDAGNEISRAPLQTLELALD
jgi:MarR family transcriptional regulator, temperature-dependent positive regulator of motility